MKNLSLWISLLLPVFLCLAFFLGKPVTKVTKEIKYDKTDQRNKFILDNFIADNEKYLDEKSYDDLKIKSFDNITEFKKLDVKVKKSLILSKCISIKKKLAELNENITQNDLIKEKLKQLQEKINTTIDKQVKFLYLEYGSNLHPVDKMFLEKIHE
jgi:hypothetical protein